MNLSAMRGYNAYAQVTMMTREMAKQREMPQELAVRHEKAASLLRDHDPVDAVSISRKARSMSLPVAAEREPIQTTFREWAKESGSLSGVLSNRTSGQTMAELLSKNGISLNENESYDISIDVWCAVTVTGKNAEKAKAIQNLLNSTPSGINWGLILQELPVD